LTAVGVNAKIKRLVLDQYCFCHTRRVSMDLTTPVIIRGTFSNKTFVAAEPLPEAEGPAELIVHVQVPADARPSIYDAFGKATQPRTAEDLDAQLEAERTAWGDP
jgi:hypothetical protein